MASTPDGGGGGFPEYLFTIEDDPGAVHASVAAYQSFGRQAAASLTTLQAVTVPSWVGDEGETFRARRAEFEPMLTTAAEAFAGFAWVVETFATTLEGLKRHMDALREHARIAYANLLTAKATAARAQASLTDARAEATTAVPNTPEAAAMIAAVNQAASASATANSAVTAAQAAWDQCVEEANKIHRDLATAADEAASSIRSLPGPPQAPGRSAALPSPGASPATPVPGRPSPTPSTLHDVMGWGPMPTITALQNLRNVAVTATNTLNWVGTVPFDTRMMLHEKFIDIVPYAMRQYVPDRLTQLLTAEDPTFLRTIEGAGKNNTWPRQWDALLPSQSAKANSTVNAREFRQLSLKQFWNQPMTDAEKSALVFMQNDARSIHPYRGPVQEAADALAPEAAKIARAGTVFRGLNYGLAGLNVVGDVDTIVAPPDDGWVGGLDRAAATANLAATVVGVVDMAAPALMAGTAIPVVGEAIAIGTGVYLTANWAYHNTETVKHAWDSTRDAASKALDGDWSGAGDALAAEKERVIDDVEQDWSNAVNTVKSWFS